MSLIAKSSASTECLYQTELFSTASPSTQQTPSTNLYFYVPQEAIGIHENSYGLYNEYAELVDCVSVHDMKDQLGILEDNLYFMVIKHISEGLYLINYAVGIENIVPLNSGKWLFMDEYFQFRYFFYFNFLFNFNFQFRKDLPIIDMSAGVDSAIFDIGAFVNIHDAVVTEDLKYAILVVKEVQYIDKEIVQKSLPGATVTALGFKIDGLCAIDIQTGKEVAAISGRDVFVDMDHWWQYVHNSESFILYIPVPSDYGDFIPEVDAVDVNAMNLIDGFHFSQEFNGEKLFFINARVQDTLYLFKWDFESKPDSPADIKWKLPGYNAPECIRDEWSDKWEIMLDPLHGISLAHDLNIYNMPRYHFAIYDNGYNHRFKTDDGNYCPMSRAVEYRVEMKKNGKNLLKLIFSYPKVSEYPEYVLERISGFDDKSCYSFWDKYNFQTFLGSFRRLKDGDYCMSNYSYKVIAMILEPNTTRFMRLSSTGEVLNTWYAKNATSASYRINPVSEEFRNGDYARSVYSSEIAVT